MPKFDPHEDGLFIHADGMRSSVQWRMAEYGNDGALAEEQIKSLAARFEIHSDRLRELSCSLGITLDPAATPNLISVRRSVAAKRADKEIVRAFKEIGSAEEKLYFAIERLERLAPETARSSAERQQFLHAKKAAMEGHRQCLAALGLLDKFDKTPGELLLLAPTDKRTIHDRRRQLVLADIFRFWEDSGRKLSFTTDPLTSERRGPLIDFISAIVVCLSDPPSMLGGETIVRELKAYRADMTE